MIAKIVATFLRGFGAALMNSAEAIDPYPRSPYGPYDPGPEPTIQELWDLLLDKEKLQDEQLDQMYHNADEPDDDGHC